MMNVEILLEEILSQFYQKFQFPDELFDFKQITSSQHKFFLIVSIMNTGLIYCTLN